MLLVCLELFSVGFCLQCNDSVTGKQSKITFFLAEVKIEIFYILGATNCSSRSVNIVLLEMLSLLRLLLLLVLLAAHLRQLLYLPVFLAELSALRFSSPVVPVYTLSPGNL
jgi:hypothetical protein